MLLIRNILFAVAFYANTAAWLLVGLIGHIIPARYFIHFSRGWARTSLWLFQTLIGTKLEVRGLEHIPTSGAIIASKHQSVFETFALIPTLERPAFVYKKELDYLPLFGAHLRRAGQIAIERTGRAETIRSLTARAREALAANRQIIIFPEGTRRAVGAPPDYKIGIAQLYRAFGAPVVPVALNTGLAWPRRRFMKRPYPVVMEFLEPIPAGLPPKQFFALLQDRIEASSSRLAREALDSAPSHNRADTQSSSAS